MSQTDRIPTIDLLPSDGIRVDQNDDQLYAKKKKIKQVINQACSLYGFIQIINHGVPVGLMSQALDLSKTFFDCPDDEKLKFSPEPGAPLPAGYIRANPLVGQYERLLMFTPNSSFKNIYPDNPPEFREVLQEIFSHLTKTGSVIEAILNESYQPATETESRGLSEHQDSNCITFVLQDDVGGLEVLKDGKWIPVIPDKSSIIVNIGDVIQVLTNNKYKSATHRVVSQMGSRRRHSFAFFYNLEGDKWVELLPQFTTDIGEEPKYRGFCYKDYQALRLRNKTHPPSRPEDFIDITHYAIPNYHNQRYFHDGQTKFVCEWSGRHL
ncbi:hypothetical protein MKX03_010959 [Papaver bracteatum]|nr:hypothetical protein MKX03_010959 [Papaver bracteatum]